MDIDGYRWIEDVAPHLMEKQKNKEKMEISRNDGRLMILTSVAWSV